MENLTLEKIVTFDCVIDTLQSLQIDDNVKYEITDDNTHAKGTIKIDGNVNTVLGVKTFNECVDVDIFAPFDKQIDRADFKILVKDYSYIVNQNKLIIYLIVSLDGFVEQKIDESDKLIESNESIVEDINKLNETIKEEVENREVLTNNEVVKTQEVIIAPKKLILKENEKKEEINSSWATDMFKLDENYSLFMKITKK